MQPFPLKITRVTLRGHPLSGENLPLLLPGKPAKQLISYRRLVISQPGEKINPAALRFLRVEYTILGGSQKGETSVHPYPALTQTLTAPALIRQKPNLKEFPFITRNERNKIIFTPRGDYTFRKTLVIPPGYTFLIGAGTHIDLQAGSDIISYSPLRFIGSEEEPIRCLFFLAMI